MRLYNPTTAMEWLARHITKDKMVAGDPVVHLHGGVQASVKYRAAALGAAPLRAAQMECAHRPRPSCATEL